jgi:hypothetical protein
MFSPRALAASTGNARHGGEERSQVSFLIDSLSDDSEVRERADRQQERANSQQERTEVQQERIDLAARELAEVSDRLQAAANALRESI